MSTIDAVEARPAGLTVTIGGTATTLSWRWVRDHGEDESSFDPTTKQRRVYAIAADEPAPPVAVALSHTDQQPVVAIDWGDDEQTWISHQTVVSLLSDTAENSPRDIAVPWHCASTTSISVLAVEQVLNDDTALASWVRDIATYGFAVLRGYSGGHDAVTTLARRIGYPRSTIFGPTWDLASDLSEHDDTAYSQSFLAPHTDGTYSHEAPGLQMFCCIERTGTGGESIVVDAFAIAETLRTEFPTDFEVLTQVSVPAHYIEPGVELRAARPAIRLDSLGRVCQVSMNNYDRSPMHLRGDAMRDFYRAYGRLHDLANDRGRWKSIRLEPGDVLINDNWRVLHGRESYTGTRRFIGCYLNYEDFESRFRTLDVQAPPSRK